MNEINLPAAIQFPQHRMADQRFVKPRDPSLDRQAVVGGRFQVGNIAHSQKRHVQRPRNRRGGHRQHIDDLPQRLEPLLHLHAKALLFVDDHQPQVLERHVVLCQPMRADDDVDAARGQPGQNVALFLGRAKSGQAGDGEWKSRHPRGKGPRGAARPGSWSARAPPLDIRRRPL